MARKCLQMAARIAGAYVHDRLPMNEVGKRAIGHRSAPGGLSKRRGARSTQLHERKIAPSEMGHRPSFQGCLDQCRGICVDTP